MLQYTGGNSISAIVEFCGAWRAMCMEDTRRKDLLLCINRDVHFFMCLGDWIWKVGDVFAVGVPL